MTQITIDIEKLGEVIAKHMPIRSEDIEKLGKAIAWHTTPKVEDHEELWDSDQCAAYLRIGNRDSFTQHTASLPSFPDRIELPSSRSCKRGNLRWVAAEVKEWALLHRRKKKA